MVRGVGLADEYDVLLRCVTVGDACAALTKEEHDASLHNLEWFGGVYDTEQVEEVSSFFSLYRCEANADVLVGIETTMKIEWQYDS